jgi:UDP-3-O-[3-hydroxymyristoyl] N-acetylglucosamine deacetylase
MQQQTLQEKIEFFGIGVHSGKPAHTILWPAQAGTGLIFKNMQNRNESIAVGRVLPEAAMHATVIKADGWMVSTIEHLLAALSAHGVDNAVIEVNGAEVPILDGSALLFSEGILTAGLQSLDQLRQYICPRENITLSDEQGRSISLMPAESLSIEYTGDFNHSLVGSQKYACTVTGKQFMQDLAPARTFGFLHQLPFLRQHKLAQGTSLGNTVVIGDELLNDMRLPDECIRHKVLDLLGDLSLLGKPLKAKIIAHKTGHSFNRLVIDHYLKNQEQWSLVD